MELWDYERQAWNSGAETVCGVDEGRSRTPDGAGVRGGSDPAEGGHPGLNDSKS